MRISFAEYIESKKILRTAAEDTPKHRQSFTVLKYCKIPVSESQDKEIKTYISLKPKDVIDVIWEKHEEALIPNLIILNEEKDYFISWSGKKFNQWLESTCNSL